VTFDMVDRNEDVSFGDGGTDFGFFDVFAAFDGDAVFVGAAESVCDDGVYAGREWVVAIHICGVEVVECVVSVADIERVAVGEEWHSAFRFNIIADDFSVLLAQKSHVSPFAEVNFYGDKFILIIDVADASFFDESLKFFELCIAGGAVQICKVDF